MESYAMMRNKLHSEGRPIFIYNTFSHIQCFYFFSNFYVLITPGHSKHRPIETSQREKKFEKATDVRVFLLRVD